MKKALLLSAAALFLASCGEKKEEKKEDGFEMSRAKQEETENTGVGFSFGLNIADNSARAVYETGAILSTGAMSAIPWA